MGTQDTSLLTPSPPLLGCSAQIILFLFPVFPQLPNGVNNTFFFHNHKDEYVENQSHLC